MTVNDNDNFRFTASPRGGQTAEQPKKQKTARKDTSSGGTKKTVKASSGQKNSGKGPGILYDARGVRVKKSRFSNEFLRTLLFLVIPYLILNGIIFILVTATPKIEVTVADTNDYVSSKAKFTVSCLLPIKTIDVTVDSEPIEYEKTGSTYTAEIRKNGTFYVEATALNGMHSVGYQDVSVLDDMPPAITEQSCHIEGGILTFTITDTLSGVDWSSIYATTDAGQQVQPSSIDKEAGIVNIEMADDHMEIHFKDMVGNERSASITATTDQMQVEESVTEEEETAEEETAAEA